MMRRIFFLSSLAAILASVTGHHAMAVEAAIPQAGQIVEDGISQAERTRLVERLQREQFVLAGDLRRKGPLIIAIALSHGVPWRLVIDRPTGEIIGRRALSETAAYQR